MKKRTDPYYHIEEELEAYPAAWCYIIVGGRKTGKTYSALKYYYERKEPIVFVKRTNKDVDTLCNGSKIGRKGQKFELDLSPYKPLNRDLGINVKPFKIDDGLAAFYHANDDGEPEGAPVAYILSLYAVGKYKGFDLSECEAIVFDEFVPRSWERVSKDEGDELMDLYETVARDRTTRGRKELKLICLANATNVYNPTCEILEVVDIMSEMQARGMETMYIGERGIFIRKLKTDEEMMEDIKRTGIYKAMEGTQWAAMAYENEFAYNDFSCVKKMALKGFRPYVELTYKRKKIYIYGREDGVFYMTHSHGKGCIEYNLDTEMGQSAFFLDWCIRLMDAARYGRMWFEKYTYYDLIVNYKKRFSLK